jgi:hypothetical protein|tara:strand:+ start:516 stop:1190 length:675 start_codon:yes stop_codon:yes gene_type:complete
MNYSELLTNVRNYTEVTSDVLTDSVINVFLTNVENKIQKQLDLDAFRRFSTSTLVVDNPFISLPDDFDFERGVQIVDGNADRTWLEQRDTTFIDEYNVDRVNNKGTPKYYANWDKDTFIVAPTPNAALTVELWYNKTPERLGDGTGGTTTTTYLSNTAPEVLIYGTVSEAFSYLKNPTYVQLYEQRYNQAVQGLSVTQMGRKRRDEYADGVLRVPLQSADPGGR